MTIAAGLRCKDGVVFGADTEETVGSMRRRVFKIPQFVQPFCTGIITGACENGHLMDTFVERIFDKITDKKPSNNDGVGKLLREVAIKLYREDFALYPDTNTRVELLVAVKLPTENVEAWSVKSSVVRRMQGKEIVGCGELVEYLFERLYQSGMQPDAAALLMLQLVSMAKKKVSGVGGETYISVLTNKRLQQRNMSFSPQLEQIFDNFMSNSAGLLLATGNHRFVDEQYDEVIQKFVANMKWYKTELLKAGKQIDIKRDDEE